MQNILDYLNWRGDIDFLHDGFNEVDNLIMSCLSYIEFDGVVSPSPDQKGIPLYTTEPDIKDRVKRFYNLSYNPMFTRLPDLYHACIRAPRYRDIKVSCYMNIIDLQNDEQFSATVFSITDNLHFIAFRGTDDTIVGWKEDFEMSFMDEIPSQRQAVEYLKSVCPHLKGRYYIGGHSKGGNLAVYAAAHIDWKYSDRMIAIYNNDGPGFHSNVLSRAGYQRIHNRIRTFLPKSSVVGMILEHTGKYTVVASSDQGILQHNAFTWEIEGTRFKYNTGIDKQSLELNNTIRTWLEAIPKEERAEFVNTIYHVIQKTGARTIEDLNKEKLSASIALIKSFNHLDFHTHIQLIKTLTIFFKESRKLIESSISENMENRFTRFINSAPAPIARLFNLKINRLFGG